MYINAIYDPIFYNKIIILYCDGKKKKPTGLWQLNHLNISKILRNYNIRFSNSEHLNFFL